MLVDPPIEVLLSKTECAYELAVLVSKRARQLVDGGQPMISGSAANMVSLACKEISEGKVVCVKGDKSKEITVPKTKEARDRERAEALAREEEELARAEAINAVPVPQNVENIADSLIDVVEDLEPVEVSSDDEDFDDITED